MNGVEQPLLFRLCEGSRGGGAARIEVQRDAPISQEEVEALRRQA
jgi:hypothetical protein